MQVEATLEAKGLVALMLLVVAAGLIMLVVAAMVLVVVGVVMVAMLGVLVMVGWCRCWLWL